jgi:hypothetical protein
VATKISEKRHWIPSASGFDLASGPDMHQIEQGKSSGEVVHCCAKAGSIVVTTQGSSRQYQWFSPVLADGWKARYLVLAWSLRQAVRVPSHSDAIQGCPELLSSVDLAEAEYLVATDAELVLRRKVETPLVTLLLVQTDSSRF